jgi:hypothetical protein
VICRLAVLRRYNEVAKVAIEDGFILFKRAFETETTKKAGYRARLGRCPREPAVNPEQSV